VVVKELNLLERVFVTNCCILLAAFGEENTLVDSAESVFRWRKISEKKGKVLKRKSFWRLIRRRTAALKKRLAYQVEVERNAAARRAPGRDADVHDEAVDTADANAPPIACWNRLCRTEQCTWGEGATIKSQHQRGPEASQRRGPPCEYAWRVTIRMGLRTIAVYATIDVLSNQYLNIFFSPLISWQPKVFGVKFSLREIVTIFSVIIRNFKLWKMP